MTRKLPIEIVCHKGANEYAPENTYAAAQFCIDWGMDTVEIDVSTSKDSVMYIIHGPELDRTTNGLGLIADTFSTDIDKLDAGSWFDPKFAAERTPRFEEFLRWIKGKARLFIDVKSADLGQLLALIYRYHFQDECFFWFGDDALAYQFRLLAPKLQLKMNIESIEDAYRVHVEFRADIVELGLKHVHQELLDVCRQLGMKVMVYHQEKDELAFREICRWGVDMINTNHGDVFLKTARDFYNHRLP